MRKRGRIGRFLAATLLLGTLVLPLSPAGAEAEATLSLRIMETTDIHVNLVNYDYYQDKATDEFGLAKTATLIKQAREEVENSILIDNGDLIQGNPLGDYVAKVKPLQDGEVHPVYKAMNLLQYDVGNIGNHEFNYGLEFLDLSLKGAAFPYVNANVYIDDQDDNPDNDKNYFTPYLILDKTFVDQQGKEHELKVGVIGFVPPQIMQWDKAWLEGKVIAKDIVATAEKFVPQMKQEGADIIIAVPHSGMGFTTPRGNDENATYLLSKVPGIDAILFGHSHVVFPSETFAGIEGVDLEKGTINGVPAVEPGFWGDHLGIIDLTLQKVDGSWQVVDSKTEVRAVYKKEDGQVISLADADEEIVAAVKAEHDATLEYIRGPVATTTAPINSYFAVVNDDPSVQIVNNAQRWYVQKNVQGTELDGLPILSAAAPFKAGGRNGPSYYTDMEAGTIAVKNVADLYVYPNTVAALLVNGEQLKDWLEMSAGQFNQIDVTSKEEQALVDTSFPTYNFDVIDGVTYQIDVTQPAKFDAKGEVVNPDANRIVNLQYEGKPVTSDQQFLVVTNNYRAGGGGNFPILTEDNLVFESPDENRQVIIDYLISEQTINPSADNNWSFAPVLEEVQVTFESSPEAQKYADAFPHINYLSNLDSGFAKYSIDLSKGLVPAAQTAREAGLQVSYDDATRQVTIQSETQKLVYTLGANVVDLNGEEVPVDVVNRNGTLYLPASLLDSLTK